MWESKLEKFLAGFEHLDDVVGILVCGSYVTGGPTAHSDLDVHLVLREDADFRERGNRIVDGLLVEYFANPPKQILAYFKDDVRSGDLNCPTQFATGRILRDDTGVIAELKVKAQGIIDDFYKTSQMRQMFVLTKYGIWDMLDDLQDAQATGRVDFDFLYHNFLNNLLREYMRHNGLTYSTKTILGNISSDEVRRKYLLPQLSHPHIADKAKKAITATATSEKMTAFQDLANEILELNGGFDIGTFTLKSPLDCE
ncbi:MAG: nucleotidyltransferase domain-containing protein [Defluviitaleaceae bacterium]|nr:nucleotidyltransferase domain-containing protein [Defluviitaleaceae bacterium]